MLYELRYLARSTEIHLLTREEGTGLQKYGHDGANFVVPNGIALDEVPEIRRRDVFDDRPYRNKVKAVWVGVLRDDKNLRALIRAVALLPTEIVRDFTVIIIGPDYKGNRRKYAALAQSLGVGENFEFLGPLYAQEKFDAIESADFYVMPSPSEGMSLAVLDAMVCGKPSVMTMGCGLNYFLDRDFFVPCEPYVQDIARGIVTLFERKEDWPEMGSRARKLCLETFNWSTVAGEMVKNYKRIVERT
jgi:glycosyltransferase involved in cell wall biosynthesis